MAQLWHDERQGRPAAPSESLPETVNDMVTNTIACHGHMTEDDIIAATHTEDPWRDAKPFAPDPPGALKTLRAKYRTA